MCSYKYTLLINKSKWNNGKQCCRWILRTSGKLSKASQCDCTIHAGCHHTTLNTFENIEIHSTSQIYIDGPDICFSPSLKYSLHIFAATKLYGGGNGNQLFLTGPLQPWQTLTFQSQNFTIVIRISLQVTSRIAFIKLLRGLIFRKKYFQFDGSFVRNIFQKYLKFARRYNKKAFWDNK